MIRHVKSQEKIMVGFIPPSIRLQLIKMMYHTYAGENEAEAMEFLKSLPVIPRYIYYAVEVGGKAYCRDFLGYYEEQLPGDRNHANCQ